MARLRATAQGDQKEAARLSDKVVYAGATTEGRLTSIAVTLNADGAGAVTIHRAARPGRKSERITISIWKEDGPLLPVLHRPNGAQALPTWEGNR